MFVLSSQFPSMHICRAILERIWVPYSLLGCLTKGVEGGDLDGQEPFRPLAILLPQGCTGDEGGHVFLCNFCRMQAIFKLNILFSYLWPCQMLWNYFVLLINILYQVKMNFKGVWFVANLL